MVSIQRYKPLLSCSQRDHRKMRGCSGVLGAATDSMKLQHALEYGEEPCFARSTYEELADPRAT